MKSPRKKHFFDLPFVKAVGFSATVLSFIFSVPTGTTKKAAPAVPATAIVEKPKASRLSQTTRRPVVQSSSGSQNVNLNDVRQDVKIQYSSPARVRDGTPEKKLPVVPVSASPGSTIQIADGIQNANISGVGGKVEIRYGDAPAPKEGRSPEKE